MQRNGDSLPLFLAHTFLHTLGNGSGVIVTGGVFSKDFVLGNTVLVRAKIQLLLISAVFASFHRRTSLLGVDFDVDNVLLLYRSWICVELFNFKLFCVDLSAVSVILQLLCRSLFISLLRYLMWNLVTDLWLFEYLEFLFVKSDVMESFFCWEFMSDAWIRSGFSV